MIGAQIKQTQRSLGRLDRIASKLLQYQQSREKSAHSSDSDNSHVSLLKKVIFYCWVEN